MNILMLATRFPFPSFNGDSIVCLNRLKSLSTRHRITLVCTPDCLPSDADRAVVEQYCRLVLVPRSSVSALFRAGIALLFGKDPLQVALYASQKLRRTVERIVEAEKIHLVHLVLYRQWSAVRCLSLPVLIDANDSQQLAVRHRIDRARGPKRWLLEAEGRRVQAFETSLSADRCRVIVLSEADQAQFPEGLASVVHMGMEVDAAPPPKAARPTLAFSGHLGYYPNVEAVEWLHRTCWPAILDQVPDAEFRIIGRDPPASIRALDGLQNVVVTGFVPSVRDELARAWVALAPMSVAWGMHTKILEAMSVGTAVIASEEAARTFQGDINGMMTAQNAGDFIRNAVTLLRDPDEVERLGDAAKAYVTAHHSWDSAAAAIEANYQALVKGVAQ
tara:strand:- start:4553 stop:5722 length:1170 start_codon:yes stop_codon:yes gene_type:complete